MRHYRQQEESKEIQKFSNMTKQDLPNSKRTLIPAYQPLNYKESIHHKATSFYSNKFNSNSVGPDFITNEEQKVLIEQGKTVIILDHHEVDNYEDTGAILVNNQFSPDFSNKNMSGAGVTLMFIMLMDDMFFPSQEIYKDYFDLAAIGIIADAAYLAS